MFLSQCHMYIVQYPLTGATRVEEGAAAGGAGRGDGGSEETGRAIQPGPSHMYQYKLCCSTTLLHVCSGETIRIGCLDSASTLVSLPSQHSRPISTGN